jgi:hypothetical protein
MTKATSALWAACRLSSSYLFCSLRTRTMLNVFGLCALLSPCTHSSSALVVRVVPAVTRHALMLQTQLICDCAGYVLVRPQSMCDMKTTFSQAVGCLSCVHCTHTHQNVGLVQTARAFWQLCVVAGCNAQGCVLRCQLVALHCAYIHEAFYNASCLMKVWDASSCFLIAGVAAL